MPSGTRRRIRAIPLAFALAAAALSAPTVSQEGARPDADERAAALPLAVGRPAPELGIDTWRGADERPSRVIGKILDGNGVRPIEGLGELDELLGGKSAAGLARHHGKVLLIHAIDWRDSESRLDVLGLVRDLARANADRDLQPISIMDPGERAEQHASDSGLDWPVAIAALGESTSPYVVAARPAHRTVFVIGRSGELVWSGDAVADKRAFLAAVDDALARLGAARIERDLGADLGAALEEYYAGELSKAAALAHRAHDDAERAGDGMLRSDAQYLSDKIRETELTWLRAMREASERRREFGAFLRYVDALATAFPRTAGKAAREHEKQLEKAGHNLARLKDEREWLAVQARRPVLFPAYKDRTHDRFAKRIDKFLGRARAAKDAERRAQDLRDRYEAAPK